MTRFIDAAPRKGTARDAAGLAYVAFALDNPALYRLMLGANLSPRERFPGLVAAGEEAFERCIAASGDEGRRISGGEEAPPSAVALWSIVHGLATLVIDGLIATPPKGPARDAAIAAILQAAP